MLLSHMCNNERLLLCLSHCLLQCSAFLGRSRTWRRSHVISAIVFLWWLWTLTLEGFCPFKMPGPLHGSRFMNGKIPEQHANEAERAEREASCCSARRGLPYCFTSEPLHREQIRKKATARSKWEETSTGQNGLKHYPINRPHLTSVAFPLWMTCGVVSLTHSNVVSQRWSYYSFTGNDSI